MSYLNPTYIASHQRGIFLPVMMSRFRYLLELATLLYTNATGFGTFAAMVVVVLLAFMGTCFADIGADKEDIAGFVASHAHQLRCGVTYTGAFHIKDRKSG
eukprot:TRINITY_DN100148_c0_g1_i1.p1 TRINITY_DN100148_c0_g1~~TRINITY_DN100148_c0_g1_i1.p1  ORF type:complete len:101 (+),score=5.98 TRINITY_DN100148_c0_g1_i1:34-336(+)